MCVHAGIWPHEFHYGLFTGAWLGACLQAVHLIPVVIPLKKVSLSLISHYPPLNPQRWAGPRELQLPSWRGALASPVLCGSCITNHGCFQFRGAAATLCLEVSHSLVCSLLQFFLSLISDVLYALEGLLSLSHLWPGIQRSSLTTAKRSFSNQSSQEL